MSSRNYKEITHSKEDYLKASLELSKFGQEIHSSDIAAMLCVTRASVSRMMRVLNEDGYIRKQPYGTITLTEAGFAVATGVKEKHDLLCAFLTRVLDVDDAVAFRDACGMEHVLSAETTEKLRNRLESLCACTDVEKR